MSPSDGLRIRLSQMFDARSGRTVTVAFAHGVLLGPQPGMRSRSEIERSAEALRGADAVMVTPGLLRYCGDLFTGRGAPAQVMLLDWQSVSRDPDRQLGYAEGASALMGEVDQAAAAGAAGVMTYLYLGFSDPGQEAREVEKNARVNAACQRLGLVHLIETRAARGERRADGTYDPEVLKLHTRIGAELGADLVKTKYSGSVASFREVTESCPCPVLVAGGSRLADPGAALRMAADAVAAGARGIVFGRNIYQQPDPRAAVEAFRRVVHCGVRPDEAAATLAPADEVAHV